MKLLEGMKTPAISEPRYRNLSLVQLVRKIVEKSDRRALQEFHNNRSLFRYNDEPPLLFSGYLNELRGSTAKRVWLAPNASEVTERAYDFTIDKFTSLPGKKESSEQAKSRSNRNNMKRSGTDCRYYFNAFLERVGWSFAKEPPGSQIEEETRAATIMQGLVRRHFYLSILEALRMANPFWSRYNWRVRGRTICVWLPVSLEGRDRREWLEKNIDDPVPSRSGERERVQSIIAREFVRERFIPFTTSINSVDTKFSDKEAPPPEPDSSKSFKESLAEAVAEEKTRNIHQQRRSIRALGEERLKQLILRIFEDINCGKYEDKKIASQFNLSKATFSRFAGSRWLLTASTLPDLWRNTAQMLSNHPIFKEVAVDTGVWEEVQSALKRGAPRNGGETSHE
jgi:hypothetical protein